MSPIIFKKGSIIRSTKNNNYFGGEMFLCLENICRYHKNNYRKLMLLSIERELEIKRYYLGDVIADWEKVVGKR
jgi:hypothetical protein